MMDLGNIPVLVYLAIAALAAAAFIHFVLPKLKGNKAVAVGTADVHAVLDRIAGHLSTIVEKAATPAAPQAAAAAPELVATVKVEQVPAVAPAAAAPAVADPPKVATADDLLILCPKTGHKVPPPNPGEELLSYYVRVSPFIGGRGLADAGGLAQMQSGLHTVNDGTPASWPLLADEYANRDAYLTDAEKAAAAAARTRDQTAADARVDGAFPVSSLTLADKLYLNAMTQPYKERLGNSRNLWAEAVYGEGQAVRDAINDAGSSNAGQIATFDVAGYSGPLRTWVENRMNGG